MDINNNEYFVVSRGLELLSMSGFSIFSMLHPQKDEKPRFDRSYYGLIFKAEESSYPMVACICIGSVRGAISTNSDNVGKPFMFNQTEVELMTVSSSFVQKCGCEIQQSTGFVP